MHNPLHEDTPLRYHIGAIILLLVFGLILFNKPIRTVYNKATKTDSSIMTIIKNGTSTVLTGSKQNTPNKDRQQLKADIKINDEGAYIIFKIGCPICQSVFQTEESVINNLPTTLKQKVYYVNWESPLGQKLRKENNVTRASTLIVKQKDDVWVTEINDDLTAKETLLREISRLE